MKASLEQRDESYAAAGADDAACELLLSKLVKTRRMLFGGIIFMALLTLVALFRGTFMPQFRNAYPLQPDVVLSFAVMMFFEAVWFTFDTRVKFLKALAAARKGN
jgi:hypothetical protein